MSSISVVSACEASNQERYKKEFLDHDTELDETGFPLEGSLAMCFSCPTDLSLLAEKHGDGDALYNAIYPILVANHPVGTKVRSCQQRAHTLYNAFCALKPGAVIGLKMGYALIAYIEITEPYHFSAGEKWGNHRWGYRTLRKATREESAELEARHPVMAFYKDFVSLPADIPRLSIMRKAEGRLNIARIILYSRAKAVEAARRELERLEELERDATQAVAAEQSKLEILSIV